MNTKTNAIRIAFGVRFDRPISEDHYISPGTLSVTTDQGEVIDFDFRDSCKEIDDDDVMSIEETIPDRSAFPDIDRVIKLFHDKKIAAFNACIFCGEKDEPEINPVGMTYLRAAGEWEGDPFDALVTNDLPGIKITVEGC